MYIELSFDEINELMEIAREYDKAYRESPEKLKKLEEKLREYENKFNMPIFFDENLGEYPALVIDPEHVFIDLDRDTIIEIRRDRIAIRR